MAKRLVMYVGGLVLAMTAFWVGFTVAMRTKYPPVQNAVRRMNRAVVNPRTMGTAGRSGAYASVIRHRGRTSGTQYETPIQAVPTEDGFVIPLPYGTRADWLKNVLAAGSANIAHDGSTFAVDHPEMVGSAAADAYFAPKDQRAHHLYGVDQFLRVRRADPDDAHDRAAE